MNAKLKEKLSLFKGTAGAMIKVQGHMCNTKESMVASVYDVCCKVRVGLFLVISAAGPTVFQLVKGNE